MKYSDLSSRSRLRSTWLKFASASLIALAVAGCGGGSDGAKGDKGDIGPVSTVPGPVGPGLTAQVNVGSNTVAATPTAAAAWQALAPEITNVAVTINSPPVVTFTVKADGKPLSGLGNTSKTAGSLPGLTNFAFTLAKLVPAKLTPNGLSEEPSKWVSYLVTKPALNDATGAVTWSGTYPTYDKEGTLVEDPAAPGNYTYTFYRDPKAAEGIINGLTAADTASKKKADLGNLQFQDTLPHRLGIQLGGAAPGTGTNNPTGSKTWLPAGVNMVNTANVVYDFIPATKAKILSADATRDIVSIDTCASCHQGKVLAHGSRKDPRYCVTCHTDQTKYGFDPVAVTATTVIGTYGRVPAADGSTAAAFTFPRMIHQLHMGNKLVKTDYNLNGGCVDKSLSTYVAGTTEKSAALCLNTVSLPQDVRNCTTCHDGSATAKVKTTNGNNWQSKPSALACGSCHDGIDFKASYGAGITLLDKKTDQGNKVPVGTTKSGHGGLQQPDDSACVVCHTPEANAISHSSTANATWNKDPLSSNYDASLRTMTAAISSVTIDAAPANVTDTPTTTTWTGTGNVTVKFTIADSVSTTPVTSPTAISGLAFTFAKLNNAASGASTNWQSYTGKTRGSTEAKKVVQGYSEAVNVVDNTTKYPVVKATAVAPGDLSVDTAGVWTYIFRLDNASTAPGNITKIDSVYYHNSTNVITGAVNPAKRADYKVDFDWWKTHRVGMEFSKGPNAALNNKFNAIYDWVPKADAARPAETRNIVSMANCATCHAGSKIHKGYTTEYCVTCHNANTYDPSSGDGVTLIGSKPVDLQVIVHKLHMGKDLPSVKAGGTFNINGPGHDYSKSGFPGVITNCTVCHSENAVKADGKTKLENAGNWKNMPTAKACGSCHDAPRVKSNGSTFDAPAHIDAFTINGKEACATCHLPGSSLGLGVDVVHSK